VEEIEEDFEEISQYFSDEPSNCLSPEDDIVDIPHPEYMQLCAINSLLNEIGIN